MNNRLAILAVLMLLVFQVSTLISCKQETCCCCDQVKLLEEYTRAVKKRSYDMEEIVLRNINDCDKALMELVEYNKNGNEPEIIMDKIRDSAIRRCEKERDSFYGRMIKKSEFDDSRKHFKRFFHELSKNCKNDDAILTEMGFTIEESPVVFDPMHYLEDKDKKKLPPWLKKPTFPPPPKKEQGDVEK